MTFKQTLLSRTPMAMILVATREHYRGWERFNEELRIDRQLSAELNGASYLLREVAGNA